MEVLANEKIIVFMILRKILYKVIKDGPERTAPRSFLLASTLLGYFINTIVAVLMNQFF